MAMSDDGLSYCSLDASRLAPEYCFCRAEFEIMFPEMFFEALGPYLYLSMADGENPTALI